MEQSREEKEQHKNIKIQETEEIEEVLNDISLLVDEYKEILNKEKASSWKKRYPEVKKEIDEKIKEKKLKLSRVDLIKYAKKIPFKFKYDEYVSLETLENKFSFNLETQKIAQEVFNRYVEYPKVMSIILASSFESMDYFIDTLKVCNREDVFDVIKLMEDNFSGNEAHVISRTSELGEEFLNKYGKEYFSTIKQYEKAPMIIERFSRDIEGHNSMGVLKKYFGIDFDYKKDDINEYRGKRAGKLVTFYSNMNVCDKIICKYKENFFFLVVLREIILNRDSEKLKNYSILKKFESIFDKRQDDENEITGNYESFKNFIEFIERGCLSHNEDMYNLLLDDARDMNLISKLEKDELISKLLNEIFLIRGFFNKYFTDKEPSKYESLNDFIFNLENQYFSK